MPASHCSIGGTAALFSWVLHPHVGIVCAVPGPTDYDACAARYAAGVDDRPWNALYERPATLALLPDVAGLDVLDAGCAAGWYADRLARGGGVARVGRS